MNETSRARARARVVGRALLLALALSPALGLPACSSTKPDREMQRLMVQEGFGRRYTGDVTREEYIAPRDGITITSLNYEELNLSQQVGPDGRITVPLIGDVRVAGMTKRDVEEALTELLSEYMRKVDIQVLFAVRASKRLFVTGAAGKTGILAYTGDQTAFDVLHKVGNQKFADLGRVRIIRPDPYHPQVFVYDHWAFIEDGDSSTNIQLREDDVIYVPLTFWGEVNRQLDIALTPFKIVLGAASTIIRGYLVPATFASLDEISDRIKEGRFRGQLYGQGGSVYF
jgi:polysaccharide export outer membrane protein